MPRLTDTRDLYITVTGPDVQTVTAANLSVVLEGGQPIPVDSYTAATVEDEDGELVWRGTARLEIGPAAPAGPYPHDGLNSVELRVRSGDEDYSAGTVAVYVEPS
jgi:hypothetical protein